MNRLTAFLDWLDEAAGGLIRLAYLLAGVVAVAVYFGAGTLPKNVASALNGGLPWALAFAVETHCYITARRVRAAWQDRQAATPGSVERARAESALRVNLAVLAGLLAFSAWNQLGYLASSGWTPGGAAFALPAWLAYVVRALVVPAAFLAAAFLAPLAAPLTAQIEAEARATLADVFGIARKQRRRMLQQAERSGRDMTAALVELVPDAETRRIISHAYGAIGAPIPATRAAEDTSQYPALSTRSESPLSASQRQVPPDRPPTGPGSPSAAKGSNLASPGGSRRASDVITLVEPPEWKRKRHTRTASAEQRVRALLQREPALPAKQIAKRLHISASTASKYARLLRSESERGQVAQ